MSSSYFIDIEATVELLASFFVYGDVPRWLFKLSQLLQVGRTANHAISLEQKIFSKIYESKIKKTLFVFHWYVAFNI